MLSPEKFQASTTPEKDLGERSVNRDYRINIFIVQLTLGCLTNYTIIVNSAPKK